MIVPDVNLLIYAHVSGSGHHQRAHSWWEDLLSSHDEVGIVAPVALGFIRLVTGRRVLTSPVAIHQAVGVVDSWMEQPNLVYLADSAAVFSRTCDLLRDVGAAGNLTTDAQIAAYAIEYNASVATNDADFTRFPGVQTVNPLR